MRKDKKIATEMRKNGKSYAEIYTALKIPKATLSDWFSKSGWSKEVAEKLASKVQIQHTARIVELDKVRGQHLARAYEEARSEARKDLQILKYNPLFIAGLMLYWGEGDKATKAKVRLTNTDPELIRLFVFFLRKVCNIPEEKICAQILTYPDIDDEANRRYWSEISGITPEKFLKSVLIQGRHKTRRLGHGVCGVYVSSTYFKVKMLEWLKLLPEELMNLRYYENM
ncbi:MAG: hypothetical protein ACYCZZ_02040 [Minisyncoccota bacterium]